MGFISRKIDKRSIDLSYEKSMRSSFGGSSTISGPTVNEKTALSLTAVWAAINFYARTIASLPLFLYERTKDGKEKATGMTIFDVMHSQSNPEMVAMVYRENLITSLLMCGKSYSEKLRNGRGDVAELWPIPFYRVEEKRDGNKSKTFEIQLDNGTITLTQDECMDITGAYNGQCVLNLLKEAFGLTISLNEFASLFFGNGANMGAVVSHPQMLDPATHTNLENSLADQHSGLGKSHRMLLLDEGMTINNVGVDPLKSQALESRVFQIDEVARIFNLPPHVLKQLAKSTNNNIEHQGLEILMYSLGPELVRFEQHYDKHLLNKEQRKKYYFKHAIQGLLRGDIEKRTDHYWKMFHMGGYSTNDILELEDRNTIGSEGDKRFVMSNMIPMDKIDGFYTKELRSLLNKIAPEQKNEKSIGMLQKREDMEEEVESVDNDISKRKKLIKKMLPIFIKDIQKVVNKETKAIKNKIKKDDGSFDDWVVQFYKELPEYIIDNVKDTFSVFAELMKDIVLDEIGEESADIEERIDKFIEGYAYQYASYNRGTMLFFYNEEYGEDEENERVKKITEQADSWQENKAGVESRTNTVGLEGMTARAVILGSGRKIMWRTNGKSCQYCNNMNGKTLATFSETFVDAGGEVSGDEGEPALKVRKKVRYPQLHRNCNCSIVEG